MEENNSIWAHENGNWYQGTIGDTCKFGAEKLIKPGQSYSFISFRMKNGKIITKQYEYMTIDKLIEIAERYSLLV